MIPSSKKLVRCAASALHKVLHKDESVDSENTLKGVSIVLNELSLRDNYGFYLEFYKEGRELAEKGLLLTEGKSADLSGLAICSETDINDNSLNSAIDDIIRINAQLVSHHAVPRSTGVRDLVDRMVEWELKLFAYQMEQSNSFKSDARSKLTGERLQSYLRAHRPEWPNVEVTNFRIQPGGNSKVTALADCRDDVNGAYSIAIRAEPPTRFMDLDGMRVDMEYPVIRYAYDADLPVAEPFLLERDKKYLGMPFIVSRKMPGRLKGDLKGSAERLSPKNLKDVTELIVKIANTPVDPAHPFVEASHLKRWAKHKTLPQNTRDLIIYWRDTGVAGRMPPSSIVNRGVSWLLGNVPEEDERQCFIHGDIGFHNILFDGDRISALLDWENARVGDPAEELSNFLLAVEDQIEREKVLSWYREAGGPELSEYRLRYFEVFCCIKMAISAMVSMQRVEENPEGNLTAAVFALRYFYYIGRRLNTLILNAEACRK